jgi:hypothetical protein
MNKKKIKIDHPIINKIVEKSVMSSQFEIEIIYLKEAKEDDLILGNDNKIYKVVSVKAYADSYSNIDRIDLKYSDYPDNGLRIYCSRWLNPFTLFNKLIVIPFEDAAEGPLHE